MLSTMQSSGVHLNVKGKKVVFGDDPAVPSLDSSPPRPRGMMIHPSRMQMQTNPQQHQQQSFPIPSDRPAYIPREGGNYAPPRPLKGKLVSSNLVKLTPFSPRADRFPRRVDLAASE